MNDGQHLFAMISAEIAPPIRSKHHHVPDTNEGVDADADSDARGVVGPRSTAAGIGRALNACGPAWVRWQ